MAATHEKSDVYQIITDRIIELLENGTAPWRKPWVGSRPGPEGSQLHPECQAYRVEPSANGAGLTLPPFTNQSHKGSRYEQLRGEAEWINKAAHQGVQEGRPSAQKKISPRRAASGSASRHMNA